MSRTNVSLAAWYVSLAAFLVSFLCPTLERDEGVGLGYEAAEISLLVLVGLLEGLLTLQVGPFGRFEMMMLLVSLCGLANVIVLTSMVGVVFPRWRRRPWLRWALAACTVIAWLVLTIDSKWRWGYYAWAVSITLGTISLWILSYEPPENRFKPTVAAQSIGL